MIKTVIHVDIGGAYVETDDGYRWDCKGANNFAITIKTMSIEDITYSILVDKVRKKIGVGDDWKLKMSYIPLVVGANKQTYIIDDEDVESYLCCMNVGLRSILHVELESNIKEIGSSSVMNDNDCDMVSNDGDLNAIILYEEEKDGNQINDDLVVRNADMIEDGDEYRYDMELPCDREGEEDGTQFVGDCDDDEELPGDGEEEENGIHCVENWDDGTRLELGQEFKSKQEVKDLVVIASHKRCYDYDIINSDTWRYVLRCRQRRRGCNWHLRVARPEGSEGSWSVKVYNKMHSCSRVDASTSTGKRRGSAGMVAELVKEDYPGQLATPSARALIGVVQGKVGVKVCYRTALRGKQKAACAVRGSPEESYKRLPSYLYVLRKTNIGTVTEFQLDEENRFKYLFIALGACIEGFRGIRKVLCVDATFLRNGGALVFATGQDPNHHHYRVAISVVDGENDASWKWFFSMLKTVVEDDSELVFISDRNPSLIKAVATVYPRAHHGYCIFHLSQNVRTKISNVHKNKVARRFRKLAQIYTEGQFEREYAEFRTRYPSVAKYLDDTAKVDQWARCHFPGDRYNIGTTNSAESLNSVFKDARKYSLLVMIDAIIEKIGELFNTHRNDSAGGCMTKRLVPLVENILHSRCEEAKRLAVTELNVFMGEYSVVGLDGVSYLVNLENKTCACKRFDKDKYPCVHAISALSVYMLNPLRREDKHLYQLCSKYYLMEQWTLVYFRTVYPVPDISQWVRIPDDIVAIEVLPPKYKKKKGRQQENRFPSVGESRRRTQNRSVPSLDLEACFNSSNQQR